MITGLGISALQKANGAQQSEQSVIVQALRDTENEVDYIVIESAMRVKGAFRVSRGCL